MRNSENFRNIFSTEFNIFITVSIPKHFQNRCDDNKYNIIKTLKGLKDDQFTGEEGFIEIIRDKIINSAKHTLFINYFERQHIDNSKKALLDNIDPSGYKYIIDTPQCLDRSWKEIAKECGIINIDIKKRSERVPGIELADVVAGCVHKCLHKNNKASEIYKNQIKNRMMDMSSREYPNPNLIFYQDFSDKEKSHLDIFR